MLNPNRALALLVVMLLFGIVRQGQSSAVEPESPGAKAAVSGAATTGSGALNKLPKWDATGTNLIDSAVFESGGLVGIGTTSPPQLLQVAGNGLLQANQADVCLGIYNQSAAGRNWLFASGGTGSFASGKFYIYGASAGGGFRLAIDSSGKVGIGTANPATTLDVVGSVRAANRISPPEPLGASLIANYQLTAK